MLRCRSGNVVAPTLVQLPTLTNKNAALEPFEGMLVTINGPLTATNNFNLGVHRLCASALNASPRSADGRCFVMLARA